MIRRSTTRAAWPRFSSCGSALDEPPCLTISVEGAREGMFPSNAGTSPTVRAERLAIEIVLERSAWALCLIVNTNLNEPKINNL